MIYRVVLLLVFTLFSTLFFPVDAQKQQDKEMYIRVKKTKKSKDSGDKLNSTSKKKRRSQSLDVITAKAKKTGKSKEQPMGDRLTHVGPSQTTWTGKQWKKIRYLFCPSCRTRDTKTDCPPINEKREQTIDNGIASEKKSKASVTRSTYTIHFDVIELEDIKLDIPAFKLFKNNMTDFTHDGETEFQRIISKIGTYLGTNYEGEGVTLQIVGSASQIPTSFDPAKPHNNIHSDGSSITGETSIENNKKLAMARATELAKKIKGIFKNIGIIMPTINEIKIGDTPWTEECQRKLNLAVGKKDKAAIQKVYEPFQKDQYVKVESKERTSKTIQPNALRMYMLSTSPSLKLPAENHEKTEVNAVFIVSKKTFDQIGDNMVFDTPEDRDQFLAKFDFRVTSIQKGHTTRWYMLNGPDESAAFDTQGYEARIRQLYRLEIVDNLDEELLEKWISEQYKQ